MTLEARKTLPAGWYTDPASADRKRWWDGAQWTEHVRSEPRPAPATAVKPVANPYGLQGVVAAPRVPLSDEELEARTAPITVKPNNTLAWTALLFGLVTVGLTLLTSLPLSQTAWVIGAAVFAVVIGLVSLGRRRSGRSSIAWAPVLGILLSLAAAGAMVAGVNVAGLVNSSTLFGGTPTSVHSALAAAPTTSSVPLVFTNNAQLTSDETAAQSLATAINRSFAGGNATLAEGQAWPASIHMSGSAVVAANGQQLGTLAAGLTAAYQLSRDKSGYRVAVHGTNRAELATYDSSQNAFSWSCLANDTSCTPNN